MFQPLIEVLSEKLGVKQFNLQVSGDAQQTTVIITPQLSAAPASITQQGYSEANYVYRAMLTSPLIVQAPLGEIDTKLAELIDAYAQTLSSTLQTRPVVHLLNEAQAEAERAVANQKKAKAKKQPAKATTAGDDDDDDLNEEAEVGKVEAAPAATKSPSVTTDSSGVDPDILASLGL